MIHRLKSKIIKHLYLLCTTFLIGVAMTNQAIAYETSNLTTNLRVATFNVSMEALNYITGSQKNKATVTGNELTQALKANTLQIKNIAEIIQQTNPDIILLNEFDRAVDDHLNLHYFLKHYLSQSQNGQSGIEYPYYYQGSVNTGVKVKGDVNNDNQHNQLPSDTHGYGYFEGHFGMVLLSKYPINEKQIRTFQYFKWHDMPNALKPIDPSTNQPWYNDDVWKTLRLSSKSHWDIPVNVNGKTIHILASHPTPPVFDGPENRNGNRNHDEIRFWFDYINEQQAQYIYDDLGTKGGITLDEPFIILGDLNASSVEGDAINSGIKALLNSKKIQDPKPSSIGGNLHKTDSSYAKYHTAYWGMRADYVLPSSIGFTVKNSGVFWPEKNDENYRLIKNRQASSDHRLVWVDVVLTQ